MRIIFDSEQEKANFIEVISKDVCPAELELEENNCRGYESDEHCRGCWEKAIKDIAVVEN